MLATFAATASCANSSFQSLPGFGSQRMTAVISTSVNPTRRATIAQSHLDSPIILSEKPNGMASFIT